MTEIEITIIKKKIDKLNSINPKSLAQQIQLHQLQELLKNSK
jgi:hypothetical protein